MSVSTRLLLAICLVASAVGAAVAVLSSSWDQLVLFATVAVALGWILIGRAGHRVPTTLRPDLAHWVEARAASTGETPNDVLDRSVASVRDGLADPSAGHG